MAIQFNVDAALEKLGELVAKHGPDAIDLASHVVQIDALNTLSGVIGYGAMAGVTFWGARFCLARVRAAGDTYDDELPKIGLAIAVGICGVATAGFLLAAIGSALDVWAWVALFNPKLALAHQVLAKLTQ